VKTLHSFNLAPPRLPFLLKPGSAVPKPSLKSADNKPKWWHIFLTASERENPGERPTVAEMGLLDMVITAARWAIILFVLYLASGDYWPKR
jgi:hypothetical protein